MDKNNATRQQSLYEQAHREIRCLYQLKSLTLHQVQNLFWHSVEEHLTETVSQLRTLVAHYCRYFTDYWIPLLETAFFQ
jgi:hypothetical protein